MMAPSSADKVGRGILVTVAGNGSPDYAGDNGPAVAASLNEPKNLALDEAGCLYVADSENHVIRKVTLATGTIVSIAGRAQEADSTSTGQERWSPRSTAVESEDPLGDQPGLGEEKFAQLADISGTVRFVVGSSSRGKQFGGDGGPAAEASLNFPSAVAVGDGQLYIADTMNHRIRKVDLATGLISTIAGTGQHRLSGDGGPAVSAALNEPCALALDGKGFLYIADQSNNRVRRVDLQAGTISTIAGTGEAAYSGDGGPAREATLAGPSGLAMGPDGALYIADTFNGRIRRVDPESGIIGTVVGDGGEYRYQGLANEFSTSVSRPYGIAVDPSGAILITDSDSHLIRRWESAKKIVTHVAGTGVAQYSGDGGAAAQASLNYPFGVGVDPSGNIYIADTFNHRIRMIAA